MFLRAIRLPCKKLGLCLALLGAGSALSAHAQSGSHPAPKAPAAKAASAPGKTVPPAKSESHAAPEAAASPKPYPNQLPDQLPPIQPAPGQQVVNISMHEAVVQALASNLDIAIQRLEPESAKANLLQNKGTFDPTVGGNFRYNDNSSPRTAEQIAADGLSAVETRNTTANATASQTTALGTEVSLNANAQNSQGTFNGFRDEYSTFAGFEVRQPVLKNFGTDVNLAPIRIAQKQVEQSQLTFLNSVEETVLSVQDAYYELMYAIAEANSRENSLHLAEKLLSDNETRLKLGAMTPLDVSQARSEVATRKSELLSTRQLVAENANTLKRLITRDIVEWLKKDIQPTAQLSDPSQDPPALYQIAEALRYRFDYQAILNEAKQRNINVKYRQNQLLPQVDLLGSYGFSGIDKNLDQSVKNVFSTSDPDWFVGFTVEIPLGNRAERGRYDQAKIDQQRTLLNIKKLEQDIIVEVDNSARRVNTNREQVETTRIARIFADENVKAEEERLKQGVTTSYVVLQLQRDLVDSRTRELRALADYFKSRARLQRAKGTLLSENGIKIGTPP